MGWVKVSLVATIVMIGLGAPLLRSRFATLAQAVGGTSRSDATLDRRALLDPLLLTSVQVRLSIALGVVYVMVARPMDSLTAAILVVVAAGCGLAWSMLVTRSGAQ